MPTTVVESIGSGGGRDFSTWTAWEAALPSNLVSADEVRVGEGYNDAIFNENVDISGITTDATRYIEMTAAAGESFQDNPDIRTTALRPSQANGVLLQAFAIYLVMLRSAVNYTRINRLQIVNTAAPGRGLEDDLVATNQWWKDNIVQMSRAGTGPIGASNGTRVDNCIGISLDSAGAGVNTFGTFGTVRVNGCLFLKPSDVAPGGTGATRQYGSPVLTSTTFLGFTTATNGGFDASSGYNASDLASGLPGSNNQHSVTFTQVTPITDADKDAIDARSIEGTDLIANGLLNATFAPNDISGTPRADPPTIGPWEVVSTPPPPGPGAPGSGKIDVGSMQGFLVT